MKNKEVQESLRQVGIRLIEEPPLLSPEPMSSPEAAVRVLGEWLSEMDRELFCVVNLNSNLTPINMNVVSMGALNVAYVHPRDAMKSAILSNAAYLNVQDSVTIYGKIPKTRNQHNWCSVICRHRKMMEHLMCMMI